MSAESGSGRTARMVYYSGMVQGVGFRATAVSIAHGHNVTGWVRNLSDGRVQLLVEGAEPEVQRFLQEVRQRMRNYVDEEKIEERPATGQFTGFHVVR